MTDQYQINANNIVINSEIIPCIKSKGTRLDAQIDITDNNNEQLISYDVDNDNIKFFKTINFNNVTVENWSGGGGGGVVTDVVAETITLKQTDDMPNTLINKDGIILSSETGSSIIFSDSSNTSTVTMKKLNNEDLIIESSTGNNFNINIQGNSGDTPLLKINDVAYSSDNLSDTNTLINTSDTDQVKIGGLQIGELTTANFFINTDSGGLFTLKKSLNNNHIEARGVLSNASDLNLVQNDSGYQTNIRFSGEPISAIHLNDYDTLIRTTSDQSIDGIKTFTENVKVNQLEVTGFSNNIEILNNGTNGNLQFKPTTTVLTNLDLLPNTNGNQGELLYNNVKPDISSWGGYATMLASLVDTTNAQTITGVKTFTTRQLTAEGTGIQYGTTGNNIISGTANILSVDSGNSVYLQAASVTKLEAYNNGVKILEDNTGVCYYHGATLNEEIMNKGTTETLIDSKINGNDVLTAIKNNIIEGGYGGTADPDFSIAHRNPLQVEEFQHTFDGTTWSPSAAPNIFNVNCNLGISSTKDIVRGALNIFEIITKMVTSYRVDGDITVTNGSTTPITLITNSTLFSTFINNVDSSATTIALPQGLYKCQIEFTSDLGSRNTGTNNYYNTLRGSFDVNIAFPIDPDTNDTLPVNNIPVCWVTHAATISAFPEIKFIMELSGSYKFAILTPTDIATQASNTYRIKMTHISDYPLTAI